MSMLSLSSIETENRLNILLFGCSGVGKSCFLNTGWTNEHSEPIKLEKQAQTREFDVSRQCTLFYHQYDIVKNVRVFDTLGWNEGANYLGSEFQMMLLGRVEDKSVCSNLNPTEACDDRIIDVVCFLLSGDSKTNDDTIKNMKPFVETAQRLGKSICFIITKMDVVVPSAITSKPEDALRLCTRGPEIREIQRKIATTLQETRVFPIINYTYLDQCENELVMLLKKPIMSFFLQTLESKNEHVNLDNLEPLSVTKSESDEVVFRYVKKHPIQGYETTDFKDFIQSSDPRGVILSQECFFRSISLHDKKFRLFVVKSLIIPNRELIGVLDDNGSVYFESTIPRTSNTFESFQEAFGPNRVPEYCFLSEEGLPFAQVGNSSHIEFLRLDLKVIPPFLMKKKGFGTFQMMIENQNQMKKFVISFCKNILNPKMNEKPLDIIINEQKEKIGKLEEKIEEQETSIKLMKEENDRLKDEFSQHVNETKNVVTTLEKNFQKRMAEKDEEIEERMKEIIERFIFEQEKIKKEMERERKIQEEKEKELKRQELSKILSIEQFNELKKLCGFDITWRRLFRASEHPMKEHAKHFHDKCGNVNETLVIVKSDSNCVFGGWNPKNWSLNAGDQRADGAWVFGFKNNQNEIVKFEHNNNGKGVHCNSDYGPIFGGSSSNVSYSFLINYGDCSASGCHTNLNSGNGYPDKGFGDKFLNGGSQSFKTVDYEVFVKQN